LKDFSTSKAYSAAFNEYSEPSIACIICENFEYGTAAVDYDNLILYDNIKDLVNKNKSLSAAIQSIYMASTFVF
jgi:hypothetical protein